MTTQIETGVIDQERAIAPRVNGRFLGETLAALAATGSLSRNALDAVKSQATRIMTAILSTYETHVARGEVGPDGTGAATRGDPRIATHATGLLYGRVQSGKTLAMITTTALALDNGFRVIVVLTSDNVSLVEQTAARFAVLPGVNVKDSSQIGSWVEDEDHIRSAIGESGLVLITAKNTSHLSTFIDFLKRVGASEYPALILDDEADQASLDTTTSSRSRAKAKGKPPTVGSSINRKTNYNDKSDEKGFSIRATLRHHVYLQVTATPYALLLQRTGNPLRPVITELLEPGEDYTGSAFFFPKAKIDSGTAPLVYVAADESDSLDDGDDLPDGLRDAIAYFLVAAAVQGITDPRLRFQGQNFLCHTSVKKDDHKRAAEVIKKFLKRLYGALREPAKHKFAEVILERGFRELTRTVDVVPPAKEIEEYIRRRLVDRDIKIVNSEQDEANFGPKLNFIVGGNILGRGLTIENLLVTYYLRSAKIAQMDTVLQHARMFGYRRKTEHLLRVYIPELQALRFHRIHQAEASLRELLADGVNTKIPVQVAKDLRATRTNVLDTSRVVAYVPGEHLYPTAPLYSPSDAARQHREALERVARLFPNGIFSPIHRSSLVRLSLDQIIEAIEYLPYEKFAGENWDPVAITNVLRSARDIFTDGGYLYAREAQRTRLTQGMVYGQELATLRRAGGPVLCVFRDSSGGLEKIGNTIHVGINFTYVFPELVLPAGNQFPAHVFNDTEWS